MVTDNHILELTTRLQYKDRICSNFGYSCYSFSKIGHISLDNNELRMWNELFHTWKDTTVKYCPPKVLLSAISRRDKAAERKIRQENPSLKTE